jgi:hypothetical protein
LEGKALWYNAEFSLLQDAIQDLWERFAGTPFSCERVCRWLATQGINRVDAREVTLAEVRRMLERELTARQPAPPAVPSATDGPWSKADSPARWAMRFKISPRTFKRRVADGTIRAKALSDRLYQVHLDDLPTEQPGPTSGHK